MVGLQTQICNEAHYNALFVGLTGRRSAGSYENAGLVALETVRPTAISE